MKLLKASIEANHCGLRSGKFTDLKREILIEQVPVLKRATVNLY